ncbi:phage-type endonuclease, partial [gut metagenome]
MKDCIKEKLPATHEEWLKQRNQGIGGSDAGAVLGLNPYKSRLALWAEKTGKAKHQEQESEAMRIGTDLEDYVANRFKELEHKRAKRSGYCYRSKQYPFMRANVDRLIIGENSALECKTANPLKDSDYSKDIIPPSYYCQCLHYMAVCGFDRMYLAVLVFQKGFYTYCIDRSDAGVQADIDHLIEEEKAFWALVESGQEPQADGSEATSDTLKALHHDEGITLDLCDYDDVFD